MSHREIARPRSGPGCPLQARGAATLALTMLLFFTMVIGVVFVNRNLVFEQRASANQYRSTQAFEAAEAGLEWALALLNDNQRIGADCQATVDATATSFRLRYLTDGPAGSGFAPAVWVEAGATRALNPACVRADAGWRCSCPDANDPVLTAPAGDDSAPAFRLQFQAGPRPGMVRAIVTGCTRLAGPCASAGTESVEATSQIQVLLGLLPALRTTPAAALTVRGAVEADLAAFGAHHPDPGPGALAIHAGGGIAAGHARLTMPAGSSTADALAANDAGLAGLTPARFFASWFGVDKTGWSNQPVVRHVVCDGDCTNSLLAAAALDSGAGLIHVEGDLSIRGPADLGSLERPVVIVATGTIRVDSAVTITGLLYGGSVSWNGPPTAGAFVHGALISEGDYRGDGTPQIVHDVAVLARLTGRAGTFARVNGSWRDF